MTNERRTPPPLRISGNGYYWSAERRPEWDDLPDSYEVAGSTIRFFPEDGVSVPLWDDEGVLNDDPEWLEIVLGLSAGLVADLSKWGNEWNKSRFEGTPQEQGARLTQLRNEAHALVARVAEDLRPPFTVVLSEGSI